MRKLSGIFQKYWEEALTYVFPKECFGCQKEGEYLCSACFDKIELLGEFPCFICNQPGFASGVCPECAARTLIDRIVVATPYTDSLVGKMVESFKYGYIQGLDVVLANILAKQIDKKILADSLRQYIFTPIPLHKKRLTERGFNQAAELAKIIASKYGCSLDESLFHRVKYTRQQAKLSREERQENLLQAFQVNPGRPVPEKVILLDDVLTTGATFAEAAGCLKDTGAKEVSCLALCHG